MIFRTFTGIQSLTSPSTNWGGSGTSLPLYNTHTAYADIYRTQPNVRICVDFLARNIAQLSWPVYRRVSDTDRERLADHELARWLSRPNPATSRYRLFEGLISDLGIYFNAYWLKVRVKTDDGRPEIGLVRLPPDEMRVEGGLLPTHFVWTSNGREKEFPLSEIAYFNGYNPTNPLMGLAPLETLRRILSEEVAASDNRESYWRNAGRMEGVWERDKDSPKYTVPQLQSWREQWQEYAGGGAKVGTTAVGELGWTYKPTSFSAKDSEYIQGGKLRREVCAAAYHIPQPLVGILDHATFSNIKEQHKHLYQDTLGPYLEMVNQEIERQLLIECQDQDHVYIEANIESKLQGSFEEQAAAILMATGKPWMKTNEARALRNLPRDDDPESDRIAPQQGGPAADAQAPDPDKAAAAVDVAPVVHAHGMRLAARLEKVPVPDRPAAFSGQSHRWVSELADDLAPLVGAVEADRLAVNAAVETLKRLEEATL